MNNVEEVKQLHKDIRQGLKDISERLAKLLERTESLKLVAGANLVYPFSDPPNSSIKYISVHHSASRADVSREDVLTWHKANGWPADASGYHAFIKADGEIEWGDMDATLKYIVGFHNPHTLGVCLAGNFHPPDKGYTGHPTPAQLESLRSVLAVWRSRYPEANIVPHRHFGGTVCPGDVLAKWMEENYAS